MMYHIEISLIKSMLANIKLVFLKKKKANALLIRCVYVSRRLPGGTSGKEPACQCKRHKRPGFDTWVGKIPWRRTWQPTAVFLPGESHGQRSSVGATRLGLQRVRLSSSDLALS